MKKLLFIIIGFVFVLNVFGEKEIYTLYGVQVFATSNQFKAIELTEKCKKQFPNQKSYYALSGIYKVIVGEFKSKIDAENFKNTKVKKIYKDAFIYDFKQVKRDLIFSVQMFSGEKYNAEKLSKNIKGSYVKKIEKNDNILYKVLYGKYKTLEEAEVKRDYFKKNGYPKSWIYIQFP